MVLIQVKKTNKNVLCTRDQISNTLDTLITCGLARIRQEVCITEDRDIATISWRNHVPGRHNSGKSFLKLEQYAAIYESGAYHCILFDGSIIRVSFKFDESKLVRENLLFWPAPINIPEDEIDELGIREALDLHLEGMNSRNEELRMRSPFRLDFDPSNCREKHPATHIHMQHEECRISVNGPICFNTFVRLIFQNFYPDQRIGVIDELETIHYSGYDECKNAYVRLNGIA